MSRRTTDTTKGFFCSFGHSTHFMTHSRALINDNSSECIPVVGTLFATRGGGGGARRCWFATCQKMLVTECKCQCIVVCPINDHLSVLARLFWQGVPSKLTSKGSPQVRRSCGHKHTALDSWHGVHSLKAQAQVLPERLGLHVRGFNHVVLFES